MNFTPIVPSALGLPVQVRDYALQLKDDLPKEGANRDYYIQNIEKEVRANGCLSRDVLSDLMPLKAFILTVLLYKFCC